MSGKEQERLDTRGHTHVSHESCFVYKVPGPPDPPKLWLHAATENNFTIAWSEPQTYGNVMINAYQVMHGFFLTNPSCMWSTVCIFDL